MSQAKLVIESIREVIIEALEGATGFLQDQAVFDALQAQKCVTFGQIGLGRLARHEVIATLRETLGVEIGEHEFDAHETIDGLARRIARDCQDFRVWAGG